MILIGGEFKGRRLKSPKGSDIRPTTSLVRKALFDICKGYIEEVRFLDLFAGTGAIGLEALSRGAAHVTFIDQNKESLNCLTENIKLLKCENRTKVYRGNSLLILKKLKEPFDILYIDPPYEKVSLAGILAYIDKSTLLNEGGHIFLETSAATAKEIENSPLTHIELVDIRPFGKTLLYHFIHIS